MGGLRSGPRRPQACEACGPVLSVSGEGCRGVWDSSASNSTIEWFYYRVRGVGDIGDIVSYTALL